jgi:aryl-alcohol dehydrogenase-like predicted oxidoreductase
MNLRKLGNSGLEIAPLVLGGNVFGWTIDEAESYPILDAFAESGSGMIDTADMYSRWKPGNQGGESETIIGKWLARSGRRDKVLIATKVGMEMGPQDKGLSKPYIVRSVEHSLKRLQTDRIDLYQAHQDDEGTPLEETLEAFTQLIKHGKVRAIGASNYSAARLAKALEVSQATGLARYECLQPHYNLLERKGFEAELEAVCQRAGLGVIPYFSLASGFLTGKYRREEDFTGGARAGSVKKYWTDRGRLVLKALDEVASRYRSTPARVALAWLLARPSITAPIASATTVEQLQDILAATELGLDQDAITALDTASAE